MRVLFILKRGTGYDPCGSYSDGYASSGLVNSAKFAAVVLRHSYIQANVVEVVDNTFISGEVQRYRADVVIIEALWVVPEKFEELRRLHPNVKWIVRLHSDWPFLATEGIATEWLYKYLWTRNVYIGFNSARIVQDFKSTVCPTQSHKILFLPDFYPRDKHQTVHAAPHKHTVNIGCFGAIRPLKNQLVQAVAAIRYADSIGKTLRLHINGTHCEQGGEAVLRNLEGLFTNSGHYLIEHPWMERDQFLELLAKLDFVLATSLSETFCLVAADAVSVGTTLVCSNQIPWAFSGSVVVDATDAEAIVRKLRSFSPGRKTISTFVNQARLWLYSKRSKRIWLGELHKVSR